MDQITTPPKWTRPAEVMRRYNRRIKKPRMDKDLETNSGFKANTVDETTTDGTLFRLMKFAQNDSETLSYHGSPNLSFSSALTMLSNSPLTENKLVPQELAVDWTLRAKVRIMSTQPFPWNQKLKTCEEASGITGYVRCIDTSADKKIINLDTSPNARFHQCCLVWQHPTIPWLDMYPRTGKGSLSNSKVNLSSVKESILQSWLNSFRSIFQLVRAKQCPYFYLITNCFVCLFRASGINGYTEINVLVTPTTRGFRQSLKDEDIEFSMPLKSEERKSKSPLMNHNTDTGYESLNATDDDPQEIEENTVVDDEETDVWLQTMGLEEADLNLNSSRVEFKIGKEGSIDNSSESLVCIEGSVDVQALFNFLVNSKAIVPTTGQFAAVPPTLLSPVAFTGASLTPLKVKESIIRQNERNYHSMEIRGPILPHTIHNFCDLMKNSSIDKFSLTCANIDCSKALTAATSVHTKRRLQTSPVKTPNTKSIFETQNLSDCGLIPKVLARFCGEEVHQYDSIKYSDSTYMYS